MKIVRAHINLAGSARSVQVTFPKFALALLWVFRRTVQLALLILVLNLVAQFTYEHFIDAAQEQKARLYARLQKLNAEIDSIDGKIAKSYSNEDLLYAKFGLVVPDTSAREMGVGGALNPDSVLVWNSAPIKRLKSIVAGKLNRVDAKIERAHSSYLGLQFYIEQLQGSLQHQPSVAPTAGHLSSPFGYRTHPVTGELEKMHQGIDISAAKWTIIRVTADGVVERVADSETLGRYVEVNHGNGIVTRYGHMEKPFVKEGQMLSRYDVVGYMGSTGRTTGNHLHYEVRVNGEPKNPLLYMLSDQYSVE